MVAPRSQTLTRRVCLLAAALLALPMAGASCSKKEPSEKASRAEASAAPLSPASGGPLKVAFAYVGPVGDAGWTFAHDRARKIVAEKFGSKIVTTFVENVP